jgi:hypothetical protein
MSEISLLEAFAQYKVKSSSRARSGLTADGKLVLSCHYARFQRAETGLLKYEEDLADDRGTTATLLRTHLAEALTNELEVRLIIATPTKRAPSLEVQVQEPQRPARVNFVPRKDLVGRVTHFDGSRFVVEFRRITAAA